MQRDIKKVGVIGAGTMGGGIAGVCAAAGIPVVLLDVQQDAASQAIERLTGGRRPVLDAEQAARISSGSIADDLQQLQDCDWICEVIIEDLAAKRALFEQLEPHRKPGSIITSNTSGIPLRDICAGMPEEFRRNVAITHFFNPVHIMRLLELVPGEDTDAEVTATLADFCTNTLNKGVVYAKDTVNFIGNRIGCFWVLSGLHRGIAAQQAGLRMETIDALLSKPVGLPPTGLYGLVDLIGLDIMELVAQNLRANLPEGDAYFDYLDLPAAEQAMIAAGQLGRKTGGGYYKMTRLDDGSKNMEVFDLVSQQWRALQPATLDDDQGDINSLLFSDSPEGQFAWDVMSQTLAYSADRVPEIADDIVNVDRAMRWGFSWAEGPFELIDRIGAARFTERLVSEGKPVPAMLKVLQSAGAESFYQDGKFLGVDGNWHEIPAE